MLLRDYSLTPSTESDQNWTTTTTETHSTSNSNNNKNKKQRRRLETTTAVMRSPLVSQPETIWRPEQNRTETIHINMMNDGGDGDISRGGPLFGMLR
ncbi:MAG: hypothetical protein ACI8RD_009686 [Bacillariaceae sp.]